MAQELNMVEQSKDAKRFDRVLKLVGPIARKPSLAIITKTVMVGLAKLTIASRKAKRKESTQDLTKEWLRMFPRETCSIEKVEDETGYGLVHANCPLVGTGDVSACYKMMEYDRALMRKIGGELTVIESRANPNVKGACKIAIRKLDDKRNNLIPAHLI